jgi:NNP family nitrate/nitrite transporter-like MFS transporter
MRYHPAMVRGPDVSVPNSDRAERLPVRHLLLGTLSFGVCFAAWGLISAFAPAFRQSLGLSGTQTALLVAAPVLLGSIARIPMGMASDRFGARAVFAVLMLVVAIPVALVPHAATYAALLVTAFFLGLAGASFPIGVDYVSRWSGPKSQGASLGIYGLGNAGQSAAVFLGPVVAASIGRDSVFRVAAVMLIVWGAAFALTARNAPSTKKPSGLGPMLRVMTREPLAWALSAFYFLTFGGFVAFAVYLPTLLKDQFGLSPAQAGLRAAGFVILATGMRPVGGWLADRIGGARVLAVVFAGLIPFALILSWPAMVPFTVGALGCAALLGLGNGAVFKLVPQHFPQSTGTVGGLVGAVGGLGGFFPPLLLGFFRDHLGVLWPGYALLAVTALVLAVLNRRLFLAGDAVRVPERLRAGVWASLWTGLLAASIVIGSRNLENFDAALVVYTFAVVFAAWGVLFHYFVWITKPPTAMFWRRGWELTRARGWLRTLAGLVPSAFHQLIAQGFIRRRSVLRWWMHQCLFWGCLLGVAVTFPLVFGWVFFRTAPGDTSTYVAYVFGFRAFSFPLGTLVAWTVFHALDISAFLVLAGIALALWRRMREQGALALQTFAMDFVPLLLLFAVSVTGLALTASTLWLRGAYYPFLSLLHAICVIGWLLQLPFGKFFHIFQRPAQLGVKLYERAGDEGEGAMCARCGHRFASLMHVNDLRQVLGELGYDYATPGPAGHWQALCPECKRASLAVAQLRLKEESRG